jgi:hypothetical protein
MPYLEERRGSYPYSIFKRNQLSPPCKKLIIIKYSTFDIGAKARKYFVVAKIPRLANTV